MKIITSGKTSNSRSEFSGRKIRQKELVSKKSKDTAMVKDDFALTNLNKAPSPKETIDMSNFTAYQNGEGDLSDQ